MRKITYEAHVRELLKNKKVREKYERLLPEFELVRSLIEQRLRKKMTQGDIAKKAGIPQSTVSRVEGLTHGLPKLATLKKIAETLDAELVIKLEPKGKYMLPEENERPLAIGEARKIYGKRPKKTGERRKQRINYHKSE